jgi:hypothetical protein
MPASINRPVAAGHRHLLRVHGIRALRLFAAVAPLVCASVLAAAEAPGQSSPNQPSPNQPSPNQPSPSQPSTSQLSLDKNSFYLTSAGFRVQIANDPAGQKALRALPAHRFVASGVGDALRYSYAEPQHCVCIFVGTQQAYDNYNKMVRQPLRPTDNVPADYKTQAGVLLYGQPLRQSTRGDPTTLSDYLGTLRARY